uniref:Secondary ossification center associated regulator of chondrocyte maturation n=1 Tax=Terrapene triunguis TaxID=2587831 RepID=A0A674I3V4_9SAUR
LPKCHTLQLSLLNFILWISDQFVMLVLNSNPVLQTEYPQGPAPTLWNEPPELPSGGGPFDAATTMGRFSDSTAFPPYTSEYEPEDTTRLHRLDDNGTPQGPGVVGATMITALLGTSVIVALIVVTLQKFSVS